MYNNVEYGELSCPNCQHKRMNKYEFWSSRLINECTKQWLFYNKIKKKRGWKCWSIFELCGRKTENWYDPCGCCFNPFQMDKETIEKSKAKDICCILIIKLLFLYFLYGFIYIGYVFLFFWFDIVYCICYKEKFYKILMANREEKTFPINDGFWKHFEITGYQDFFWEENFQGLFKCERCHYEKNTFYEFLRKQRNNVVNNNQDTEPQLINITDSNSFQH